MLLAGFFALAGRSSNLHRCGCAQEETAPGGGIKSVSASVARMKLGSEGARLLRYRAACARRGTTTGPPPMAEARGLARRWWPMRDGPALLAGAGVARAAHMMVAALNYASPGFASGTSAMQFGDPGPEPSS